MSAEVEIRALLDGWSAAVRDHDVDRVMACYASEARIFDAAPPLAIDIDGHRAGFAGWFASWSGPIGNTLEHAAITVDGGLAMVTALSHLTGQRADGSATDVWMRVTLGLRHDGNSWRIVHEHVSLPMLMDGSDRAATDLRPVGEPPRTR